MAGQMLGARETRRTWLVALLLAAATLAVYWPVRHSEFLNWDDLTYITTNDHVRGGITWENVVWAFTQSYSSNWHPLTWLSHGLDCQFFGLNAGAHHLVNLAFHVANTLLLFGFLRCLTGALWRSAMVAALFALHPLHVESVAWLAERKDVLSTFFFLLTLLAYARFVQSKVQSEGRGSRVEGGGAAEASTLDPRPFSRSTLHAPRWYILALVFFALGLMSKPMLVTLPFVLLLLDYWPLDRPELRIKNLILRTSFPLLREKLPFFALSAGSCLITFLAQQKGGAVAPFDMLPFGARVANAAVAYGQYLLKFFWPAALSPIYPHPPHWGWWRVGGSSALLALLTAAAWAGRRRFPWVFTGWFWFAGTLVPVIGLVQVGSQAYADRYTYIPLIGVMIAVVWMAVEIGRSRETREFREMDRSGRTPGEAARAGAYRFCVFRGCTAALLALAIVGALAWRTSAQLAYWEDTGTLFGRALALDPNNVQALHGLGVHLVDRGRIEAGKPLLERAIQLQPQYPEPLGSMADLLDGQGKYAEAIAFYRAALKANPDHPGVLNNLAWLRASCPDPSFRNGPEAVRLARRACELTGYGKPLFVGTLAAAQAEAGDFQGAIATAERAAALATALRLEDIAAKNRQLIELYRQGKTAAEKTANLNR